MVDQSDTGTQSVDRALLLLERIGAAEGAGATLAGLVAQTGLNKATVRRLALALIRAGMAEQDAASRYHLGARLHVLGAQAARRPDLVRAATESVMRLAHATGDAALLSVRRGAGALCLMREEGSHPLRSHALVAGQSHPLGIGAGALAMLAGLPDEEVETVLAAIAPALIGYPQLDPDRLRTMIARTRAEGVALNPGLVIEGSWGLGIALRHADGRLAGALSVATVEARMRADRLPELTRLLRAEAARIEARLDRPSPGRIAPGRAAPEPSGRETTGHEKTAPEQTASERPAPQKTAPQKTAPQKTGPQKTDPWKTCSRKAGSRTAGPDNVPGRAPAEAPGPGTVPPQTPPKESTP